MKNFRLKRPVFYDKYRIKVSKEIDGYLNDSISKGDLEEGKVNIMNTISTSNTNKRFAPIEITKEVEDDVINKTKQIFDFNKKYKKIPILKHIITKPRQTWIDSYNREKTYYK